MNSNLSSEGTTGSLPRSITPQRAVQNSKILNGMPFETSDMIFNLCDLSATPSPGGWGPVPPLIVALRGCSDMHLYQQALKIFYETNMFKLSVHNNWSFSGLSPLAISSIRIPDLQLR